jgi:hypothetical protein
MFSAPGTISRLAAKKAGKAAATIARRLDRWKFEPESFFYRAGYFYYVNL